MKFRKLVAPQQLFRVEKIYIIFSRKLPYDKFYKQINSLSCINTFGMNVAYLESTL